jgi:hypothetical protein
VGGGVGGGGGGRAKAGNVREASEKTKEAVWWCCDGCMGVCVCVWGEGEGLRGKGGVT